jgi:pimeloyl-ACP methyl ester carboxylesterase
MQLNSPQGEDRLASIAGAEVELWEGGQGRPLLLLHPGDGFDPAADFVRELTASHRVIAPSHPGFGGSSLPRRLRTVDDLSYFYLDLIEELGLQDLVLVGLSFGGWIAAEIAVKNTSRIAGIFLSGSLGVKFSDPMTRDIADLFAVPQYAQARLLFSDAHRQTPDYSQLPDETLVRMARNHESFCLYGWAPTLHNPKLADRLHRIKVPTRLVWGDEDRVVSPDYGRKLAAAIPGAEFELIEGAGHYAHIERPERFAAAVKRFVASLPPAEERPYEGRD